MAPEVGEYVPTGHAAHVDVPTTPYSPCLQPKSQDDIPDELYLPTGHDVHEPAPAPE